uniref:Uncharacterized protein n=1 Tax=Callorhinchus milii TaxID=7868 RepID=A0A4W3J930_CALMI
MAVCGASLSTSLNARNILSIICTLCISYLKDRKSVIFNSHVLVYSFYIWYIYK